MNFQDYQKAQRKKKIQSNLGKELEGYIDQSIVAYLNRGRAIITKNHPEVKVTSKVKGQVKGGYFKEKGAPDYSGLSHGRGICFDAKETKKDEFPLANIKSHQVEYLKNWRDQGGISFIMVRFIKHHEVYILPFEFLYKYWCAAAQGGRKYIPYEDVRLYCDQVKPGGNLTLDWLTTISEHN